MATPPTAQPEVVRPAKISKVVSGLQNPVGIVFDKRGNLYVAQQSSTTLLKVSLAGKKTNVGSGLKAPLGLAIDSAGNLYVGNSGTKTILKMTTDGKVSTLAKGFSSPWALGVDGGGNVYVTDNPSSSYKKISPAGAVTKFVSNFTYPQGIAVQSGNVYLSGGSNTVEKVSPAGKITPINNTISSPLYDARDGSGNLYVCSYGNVWKISRNGTQTNIAKNLGGKNFDPAGIAVYHGAVYVSDMNGGVVYEISP